MNDWNDIMKEVERICQIPKIVFVGDKGILLDEFRIHSQGTWWAFYFDGERKFILYEIGLNCETILEAIEKSVNDFKELEFQHKALKKPFLKKR